MRSVAAVFFGQAVGGQDPPNEASTDGETPLGERLSACIPLAIGLETRADDERLDRLGALRSGVWPRPFGQAVFRRPWEDSVAAVVRGWARFEAEAGGELACGEATEFPEGNHADLLLDGVCFGEGDGLPSTVSEHKRAVLDLHVDVESARHDHPLPWGAAHAPRALQRCRRNVGTSSRATHRGAWGEQLRGRECL